MDDLLADFLTETTENLTELDVALEMRLNERRMTPARSR